MSHLWKDFQISGPHIIQTHQITLADYRDEFGINKRLGLICSSVYKQMATKAHGFDRSMFGRDVDRSRWNLDKPLMESNCTVCGIPITFRAGQRTQTRVICGKAECRKIQMGRILSEMDHDRKWTPERRHLLSLKRKGIRRIQSEAERHKRREKKHSEETKKLLSMKARGRKHSEKTKQLISQKAKQRYVKTNSSKSDAI
jgi:hypothetical protein